jgi:NAD(P)-dependent dehydrogenase (short-subunit alcohol dehydrogenase family)
VISSSRIGCNSQASERWQQSFDFPICSSFIALPADITTPDGAMMLVRQITQRFRRLDIVAHTLGGFAGGQSVADTDDNTFQQMFDLNLHSVLHIIRATMTPLRQSGDGRLIAIGSRAAVEPGPGVGAYSASKAAMVSLIRTVALENKDAGLRANVILPGTMDTPRIANRCQILISLPGFSQQRWQA